MSSLILSDTEHKFPKLIRKKNSQQFSRFISGTEKINFHYNLQIFLFVSLLNNFSTDILGDSNDVFAWNHSSLVSKYVHM